ncbi:hypothetical protein [Rhizobium sp. FY34]|uniref:hypothetical protein n=1 Tax=Rhizobium sp. FY34 TaxID=2562309 RepID=UPI001FEE9059|nr:hypothetical protein [Rhizobium sp. FY34]
MDKQVDAIPDIVMNPVLKKMPPLLAITQKRGKRGRLALAVKPCPALFRGYLCAFRLVIHPSWLSLALHTFNGDAASQADRSLT